MLRRRPSPIGAIPECPQRVREAFRLDPMRWVEVVSLLEHFQLEVWEDPTHQGGDLAVLVGVAASAQSEVDGAIEACQRSAIKS